MADNAPEVKVKLTAEDTGVAAAIKELGVQLKNLKKNEDDVAASSSGLSQAFKGLLAVVAVEKLLEFGKGVLTAGTSIARTAQVTGASTQTLGVFIKTADDLGVSSEAVDKGFVKLSRSILSIQQGGTQARQTFALLNITQKDFVGLNTDQKIKLVTDRLGGMADGTQKAAIAQQLLGKGGAELIPVLNELAGEGFDKARESAEKFGLLLDGDTEASLVLLQKSLKDVEDTGKGLATQFTAGIAPALTDIANAITKVTTQDGVKGFRTLGEEVGKVFKAITIVILGFTDTIVRNFAKVSADIQNIGRAIGDVFVVGFSKANQKLGENTKADYARIDAELQAREATILSELDGNSRQQDAAAAKAKAANRDKTPDKPPVDETSALQGIKRQQQSDAIAAAEASALQRHLQDELSIYRSYEKQREQIEKASYDQGNLTTDEYYSRRQSDLKVETDKELAILSAQLVAAQASADRSALESAANTKKAKQFGTGTKVGEAYGAAAARDDQERAANLAKVDELQTKITTTTIDGQTKSAALDAEHFDKTKANQQQVLDFQKELDELQGKRSQAATAEVDAAVQKRTIELQQAGQSKEQIDAEIAQYRQLKQAVADYETAKAKTNTDTKSFEVQKQGIEIKAKAGEISPLEEERQINQLIKDRLPLLQADAQAELSGAQKTGNVDNVAAAQNTVAQIQNLGQASNKLGQEVAGALSQDFSSFFETVGRGTKSVAQSFEALAGSVVGSIEKILEKQLLLKILGSGAPGGGGLLGALHLPGLGAAEGGLIKGPGGPKADAIPARLSAGEFVVKADAVNAFGAHNLDAINRGLQPPSFSSLNLPKFAEGGLVGAVSSPGAGGDIKLGISLDHGLILQTLSSKDASRIVLQHLTNNPKAASKALGRSQG